MINKKIFTNNLFISNEDCLSFLDNLEDNSVDLILTDPPFGLGESKFDNKHYARNGKNVIGGYVEAPEKIKYEDWAYEWISKFDRILKPNGSIMIFSGWTNEADIQYAFRKTNKFKMINHLIWQYNFGVYTSKKFVSSHYHILYYCKKNGKQYFNQYAYHNENHNDRNGSAVYNDIQDVIKMNKEYKPCQEKNSNQLPQKLIEKLIKHTTKRNDVVLDIFSGNFTTEFAALKLYRKAWGCEINEKMCEINFPKLINFNDIYKTPEEIDGFQKSASLINQGKPLTVNEKEKILKFYQSLNGTKKDRIERTMWAFKRGKWSILRLIDDFKHSEISLH